MFSHKGLSFYIRIPNLMNENYPVKNKQRELRTLNLQLLERQSAWIRGLRRGS